MALTIYAVALLVRAAMDAFDSVDDDLRQAAVAMGYKPAARFLQIDLPLSLPVLFAGLRVVSVSNISLVSVAALLGIGNLGMLFTDGLQRDFVTEVVVGIIAILVLALLMDAVLVLLERLLTPVDPGRQPDRTPARRQDRRGSCIAAMPRSTRGPDHEQRLHRHLRLARGSGALVRQRRNPRPAARTPAVHAASCMLIAAAIAVPSGCTSGTPAGAGWPPWPLAGALRALPTLGLLTLFVLLAGIGLMPPVWALVILTVPPLLAGTYAGISSVDRNVVDAARAMGMTELQVLFRRGSSQRAAGDVRRYPHRRAPGDRHRLRGGLPHARRPGPVPVRRAGALRTSRGCWQVRCSSRPWPSPSTLSWRPSQRLLASPGTLRTFQRRPQGRR